MITALFPACLALLFSAHSIAAPAPKPAWLTTLRVAIDAGHGGNDFGTADAANRIREKDLTLKIAKKLESRIKNLGIPVMLTRYKDEYITLEERAKRANLFHATAFVSLHMNSSASPKDFGIETYILNHTTNERSLRLASIENDHHRTDTLALILSDLTTSANEPDSVRLAYEVQATLVEHLREAQLLSRDRCVKQSLFYLLMKTEMPSILVELGFMSNPHERERLTKDHYQDRLSLALFHGILKFAKNAGKKLDIQTACRALKSVK